MQTIVIRGAGLIGSLVAEKLRRKGVSVVIVSRNPAAVESRLEGAGGLPRRADLASVGIIDRRDAEAQITAATAASVIINLEGKSISAGIWTKSLKREILKSRLDSVEHLAQILRRTDNPNLKILQASATGYYGDRKAEILTESSDPGRGFLADTCVAWESAALKAFRRDELAIFRIAPVLSNRAGVFPVWRRFFRMFLGGRFGKGDQYFSWIHEHDMAELLVHYALRFTPGVINACAPEPVKNAELTGILAEKFHRSAILHVPEFLLSKLPGDFGREMLLASVRAVPKRALADGFNFTFERFPAAVEDLC